MSRWFAVSNGLLLSVVFAATAWGQASQQSASLAERMAALRRGWSGSEKPSAHEQQSGRVPQEESPSVWSNLLGRRAGPPPGRTNDRPVANPAMQHHGSRQVTLGNRPASGAANPQARAGSEPRTSNAAPRSHTDNFTLPGLGGSPLPQANAPANASGGTAGFNVSKQPVAQPKSAANNPAPQSINNPHVADRHASASPAATVARSSPRQSPVKRPVPQVDPEVLRKELAGSFPAESFSSEPVARTPQVSETPTAEQSNTDTEVQLEPVATAAEPMPSEMAPTLPITEQTASNPTETVSESVLEVAPKEFAPKAAIPRATSTSRSAADAFESREDISAAFGSDFPARSPSVKTRNTKITRPNQAFGDQDLRAYDDPTVLVSNETPVITTDIRGPKQIMIGREAGYRVQLHNQSEAAAEGITATIRIPTWAEVVDTATSQGMIQQPRNATGPGQLEWQLSRLEPGASETLDIKLIPRASRPLELGVTWTLSPVGSRAIVQVQEPKIQMSVTGPDEVLYSEPQLFRLMLSNPGTGVAEKVKIDLIPPGSIQGTATSHVIGDLEPGASKTVEVELTAREAGKLFVKAVATAEGGLTSEAAKEIFCRKPELEVDWRGPDTKYAGTPATFYLRVRNPGTAPADNVKLTVTLPAGAEFITASEGQSYDSDNREVSWQVGTLGPGDDNYMELKCLVHTPGVNQLRIQAAASTSNLTDEKLAETNVVALADLKLEVSDPNGPVAVGEQAVYEIRVQNRGASTANEVNVVALFSEGIEPDQVEGAMYTVADGRVTFRPIEQLPAGREIVLRIRARATQAGTHVFRAEVLCRDLEIKLAAEETTRFYAEDVLPEGGSGTPDQAASRTDDGFESSRR